jgi:hypothetical protein
MIIFIVVRLSLGYLTWPGLNRNITSQRLNSLEGLGIRVTNTCLYVL